MKHIFDTAFLYSPSFATDVRRTFERIRNEQRASAQASLAKVLHLDNLKNQRVALAPRA